MKKIFVFLIFTLISLVMGSLISNPVSAQERAVIYYVDIDRPGGTGGDWTNAYKYLQDALGSAPPGSQIWVAEGVYYPDEGAAQTNDVRTESFLLPNGVAVYGGFAGTETELAQRNWTTHVTVLSGDIDQNDLNIDGNHITESVNDIAGQNAYHILSATSVGSGTVLDGFIITAGAADGNGCPGASCGGGLLLQSSSALTLENLTFIGNLGQYAAGGMMVSGSSGISLTHVSFLNNSAQATIGFATGGGMFASGSGLTMDDVSFDDNGADLGGGLGLKNTSLTISNSDFSENSAKKGGGLYAEPNDSNQTGDLTLTDVTFLENHANTSSITSGAQNCNGGGGLCYYGNGELNLTRVTFDDNDTLGLGGGMYVDNLGTSQLTDSDFNDNTCHFYSGAGLAAQSTVMTITGGKFDNNQAAAEDSGDGGAIHFSDGELTLSDADFTGNSGRLGGAMMVDDSAVEISGSTFTDNTASTSGGGIFAGWDSSLDISESTFTGNTAESGGGIFCEVNDTLTLSKVTLTRNTATGAGGGLYNASDANLTDISFLGNQAMYGGGVYSFSHSLEIESALFVSNQASMFGGGIQNYINSSQTFKLLSTTFFTAGEDALYMTIEGSSTRANQALISNSIFWGSEYTLDLYGELPTIRNCDIQGGWYEGTELMDKDPLFMQEPDPGPDETWGTTDDDYGDLMPMASSPVINAGINTDSTRPTDLAGNTRIVQGIVDLGAYEVQSPNYPVFLPLINR